MRTNTTIQAGYKKSSLLLGITDGPIKTYGKQPFTPEVPAQVLRGGRLVSVAVSDMSSLMHNTSLPPQF